MKNSALVIAGIIFTLVALLHVLRYAMGWEIMIASYAVPMQASLIGAVISILLALWMFIAASK